ncbi:hypothetical protein U1Q18_019709 [Sarracenia purpurea var. burkii]
MTNQRSKRLLDARGSSEIGEGGGEEEVHLEEGAASTRMERRKTISPEGGRGAASGERRLDATFLGSVGLGQGKAHFVESGKPNPIRVYSGEWGLYD